MDKISTMLHFAIKAGKAIYGLDNVEKSRKYKVVVFCKTLSEQSKKKLLAIANAPVILSKKPLEEVLNKSGKVIAVTDVNMAKEILINVNEDYELISEDM